MPLGMIVPTEYKNTYESTAACKTPLVLFNNLKIVRNIILAKRFISETILTRHKTVIQNDR